MATILLKKRDTTGAPSAGDLTNSSGGAEVAVNTYDKRIYAKNSGGTVVEIGTDPATFSVNSAYSFPTSDGTANYFLQTNGSGALSFAAALTSSDIGSTVQGYDVDTAKLDVAQSFTAQQTFSTAAVFNSRVKEKITVSATAATGTINFDTITQSVLYYTTNASGNWTLNVRGDGSNSLDSIMSTGEVLTLTFLVTQGATAYYQSAFQIDGSAVTPEWQGGSAPTAGNASSIDAYVFSIIKTGSATFTALGSQTQFA